MENQIFKLNNNIEVFYKQNKNTPRVALCFNLSINQTEKFAGIYTMMTRLFMQGTKNRTAEDLANELEAYAIEFSAELKQDYLRFRFICLNEDFSKSLEVMEDIIKNSTFEEFEKERIKLKGEIVAELDSPRTKISDAYYSTMFSNHHYGTTYTKILEDLDKISKQDIIDAYNQILNNSNKVAAFVGDLPFDEVKPLIEKTLSHLKDSSGQKDIPNVTALSEEKRVEIIKQDANQAHIIKGWLVPTYESEDYPALLLLNIILGASGLSSRLFLELRDKKGLAYVVRSSYEPLALCGNFSIYIATEPKNIDVSINGFKEEIDKIKTIEVSQEELDNAKNNLIGKWAYSQENNMQQCCVYSHYGVLGLGFEFNNIAKERIKNVNVEQILDCAKKYFTDNFTIAILKP